jgi:hypothetical protein
MFYCGTVFFKQWLPHSHSEAATFICAEISWSFVKYIASFKLSAKSEGFLPSKQSGLRSTSNLICLYVL